MIAAHEIAPLAASARRRARLLGLVVALLLAGLLAILAWSQWSHTGTPTASTMPIAVSGVAVISGGPLNSVYKQSNSALVVTGTTTAGVRLVRHLTTDSRGHFMLRLPAGVYTVTALLFGPANRSLASQPHAKVRVSHDHPVHVKIIGYVQ
jgi:hypothetical protein